MPQLRTPGTYIEEVSSGDFLIPAIPMSVAAFVGPALTGPANEVSPPLESLSSFESRHGGPEPLSFASGSVPNFLWHAARAFFGEGGTQLCVVRVHSPNGRPGVEPYELALAALEKADHVSLVATPGATQTGDLESRAVFSALIAHAENCGDRVALIDSALGHEVDEVRDWRAQHNSSRAALYYPWVRVDWSSTDADALQPPSGFVAGIIARVDRERGIWKSPANESLRLATGLERDLNRSQQEILNPAGINCIRDFAGRGIRLWGARTMSADPDWKYLNVRRYIDYLERSIIAATDWVTFEPNTEAVWRRVRTLVENFLLGEWNKGALQGAKPEHAFFARCNHSTMSQADVAAGRLVCLIGVSLLKPAEFIIFRIVRQVAVAA